VPSFQASSKPVPSQFQASSFFLPPRRRAGHGCDPAAERRGVPKRPGLRYRVRKGWKGYKDLTSFNLKRQFKLRNTPNTRKMDAWKSTAHPSGRAVDKVVFLEHRAGTPGEPAGEDARAT
jgi:hypothetical protein